MYACFACVQLHGSRCVVVPLLIFVAMACSSSGSADQPASKISSIHDVKRWLASDHVASCSMVERIKEAVAVLSQPQPRKEDVQPLQSKWQVAQNIDKNPRPLKDVLE